MEKLSVVFGLVFIVVLLGVVLAYPTMLLWNGCLVPAVTGVNEITVLQAWGLNVLCGLMLPKNVSK